MRFVNARRLPAALPVVLALCATVSTSSASAQTTVRQVSTDSLIYDLKNPDAGRRTEAARQLGVAKFVPAIPALLPMAEDSDAGVRRQVELALEEMNDIQTLSGFVQFSADSESDIRDRAVHALVNLHLPRQSGPTAALMKFGNLINPWLDEYVDTVVEPDVPVDASVITALRARLSDSEDAIRRAAAQGLGILNGSAAIPELVQALREDRDPEVRFEAVRALRKIGDPSVGDRLLPGLNLDLDKVRNEIIIDAGGAEVSRRGAGVDESIRELETLREGASARAVGARGYRGAGLARPFPRPQGGQGRRHPHLRQRRTRASDRRVAPHAHVGGSADREERARADGAGVRPAAPRTEGVPG